MICIRHFYFRLTLGAVFAGCMVFSMVTRDLSFFLMYLILSTVFFVLAYDLWKKEKGRGRRR